MSLEIDGVTYYRTAESCARIGISRATMFRWLKMGILEKQHKDRRGWRLFTEEDLKKIQGELTRVEVEYLPPHTGRAGASPPAARPPFKAPG